MWLKSVPVSISTEAVIQLTSARVTKSPFSEDLNGSSSGSEEWRIVIFVHEVEVSGNECLPNLIFRWTPALLLIFWYIRCYKIWGVSVISPCGCLVWMGSFLPRRPFSRSMFLDVLVYLGWFLALVVIGDSSCVLFLAVPASWVRASTVAFLATTETAALLHTHFPICWRQLF